MSKPKTGDQFSSTRDGDYTSIMAIVGNDIKVLSEDKPHYVPIANLEAHTVQGSITYWFEKAPEAGMSKGKPLPGWSIAIVWNSHRFHTVVHAKTERAAVAAACAEMSATVNRKPATLTKDVWNKQLYKAEQVQ